MKSLKFDHDLAAKVQNGEKTSTWRLYDDQEISLDDVIELIDKVEPKNEASWLAFGEARVKQVTIKKLADVTKEELDNAENFTSIDQMYQVLKSYYGNSVGPETHVKIIEFEFSKYTKNHKLSDKDVKTTIVITDVTQTFKLYSDGGSRGNPGPSAGAYLIYDSSGSLIKIEGYYLGITTNNQAEYQALRRGLEQAVFLGLKNLEVYMDSLLIVNQMKGLYKVKNRDLWPIYQSAKDTCTKFDHITFTHIPRELNKEADLEVNRVLDEQ